MTPFSTVKDPSSERIVWPSIPVAHASDGEFHVAQRPPLADVVHRDGW